MLIIPAIDLKDGKCVRLQQGRMEDDTVFSDDPVGMASHWVEQGARRLHLVDLNGAFAGTPIHGEVVKAIAKKYPALPVQIGGGIRSLETIEAYVKAGVTWVIIGTKAVKDPQFVIDACREFHGRIIVGIDAKDGWVATDGWAEVSQTKAEDLAKGFAAAGVSSIVYTDIARDGMMQGVNVEATAALARAAKLRGIPATIVMPSNAPAVKVRNVERFGARIVFCEPTQQARESTADRIVAETGATMIHPFTNYLVMAGQGTAALELLAEVPAPDLVLCPVGGGGLLCGTAVAVKSLSPATRVVACEPAGAADAALSFRAGAITPAPRVDTIADGLRTTIGPENFALIRQYVDDVVTVTEESIITAMRRLWETLRIVVEPSGAVPFAAILEGKVDVRARRVALILSGGNVDLAALPWIKNKFHSALDFPC